MKIYEQNFSVGNKYFFLIFCLFMKSFAIFAPCFINEQNMDVLVQNISRSDVYFFEELANRMGWAFKTKESILEKFIETRPKNVDLSDEDIMEEIRTIRYAK